MKEENMIFSVTSHLNNAAAPAFFGGVLADVFVPTTIMASTPAVIGGVFFGAIIFLSCKAIFKKSETINN